MLNENQISEIKEHLETAQNPLFLFDNDQDGLCAFLILQRFSGKGKGFPIKSFPDMNAEYFRRVLELNADYIFILDKPLVSKEFLDEAHKNNIPVVWIDHHAVDMEVPNFVNYYNPLYNKNKSDEPVTELCYNLTNRKEDMWIAVAGCISDNFLPSYYSDFINEFPELGFKSDSAFEVYYKTEIGKLSRMIGFGLKDRTTNVVSMMKFLMSAKGAHDVLQESPKNKTVHERFNELDKKYKKLLSKAIEIEKQTRESKVLFFDYGGDMSMSSELSNELMFDFPKKFVLVAYRSGVKANISGRGKSIKKFVIEALKDFEDSRGGGHENAVGAQVKIEDLEMFKSRVEELCEAGSEN